MARKAGFALEEITPNLFRIHDSAVATVLRGEGERRGVMFELTSWRREGLLARIAARGYRTLTLDDRIDALPKLPAPLPLGTPRWRTLGSIERFSVFDPASRSWQPRDTEQQNTQSGLWLRPGEVVRRRKGRGLPAFFVAQAEGESGVGLQPLEEFNALLQGFAQAQTVAPPLALEQQDGDTLLPVLPLPTHHRDFMRRVAEETAAGWRISPAGLPFALRALERLGVATI